ncbi:transporter substrate-binding protein [Pseudomonas aeruginosa]|nr:transporter substrate-binding protein [Pseudomonas aeruginosa]
MANLSHKTCVRIGLMCSTTGSYQSIGQAMLCGALLAIERVARDPRFTFCFEPEVVNPGGDLTQYYAQTQALLDSGIRHVVGCYTSSSRKEVLPLFERRDGLLWYPSHYEGFECSDNVIYVGASPNQHIVPLISYLMNTVGKRAYCVGSNYVWPWESNRVMREILEANDGDVVCERYLPIGSTDVEQIIDEVQRLKPDFVFSSLIGESGQAFEASFIAVLLLAEAIHLADTDDVQQVRSAAVQSRLNAPQGPVWIDPENHHCYLTPRLGISNANGDFEILASAKEPRKPDPYLTWLDMGKVGDGAVMEDHGDRLKPELRIVR